MGGNLRDALRRGAATGPATHEGRRQPQPQRQPLGEVPHRRAHRGFLRELRSARELFFIHLLPRAAAAGAASAALRRDLRLRRSQRHRRGGVVVAVRPVRGATGRFSARFLRSGVGVRANFGLEHVDLVRGQTPDLAVVNLNRLRGQRRVLLDVRERLRGGQERVQRDRGVQPRGRERGSHRGVAVRRERRFQPELAGDDDARALDVVSQRHPRVVLVRSLRGGAELREERFPRADAPAVRGGDARVVREQEHVTQKPGRHAREIVPGAQRPERGAREPRRELAALPRGRGGRRLALALVRRQRGPTPRDVRGGEPVTHREDEIERRDARARRRPRARLCGDAHGDRRVKEQERERSRRLRRALRFPQPLAVRGEKRAEPARENLGVFEPEL